MLLLIDNYDSFVFNLAQYFGEARQEVKVVRNDAISIDDIEALNPAYIVISPGPCWPKQAGICMALIRQIWGNIPLLGVCLGHQIVGEVVGAHVVPAKTLVHGKTSLIHHDGQGVFVGLETPLSVMRYHSLALDRRSIPENMKITAETSDGEIMGLRAINSETPVETVQFHPESIGSDCGKQLLYNFLAMTDREELQDQGSIDYYRDSLKFSQ